MSSRRNSASHCFAFEQDFIGNWRCIPLCVRRKLDLCGVKLKLNHWLELSQEQRQALVDWPTVGMARANELVSKPDRITHSLHGVHEETSRNEMSRAALASDSSRVRDMVLHIPWDHDRGSFWTGFVRPRRHGRRAICGS